MTNYEKIYEEAIGLNGIISVSQAKELGVPNIELVKLCKRGKLTRVGRGVYRLDKFFPQPSDQLAAAVLQVGEDAYVVGETVLGYHRLCPTHEAIIYVGTTKRVRKTLPENIKLCKRPGDDELCYMDGVRAQTIPAAIRTAVGVVEPSRLKEAIDTAVERQLIEADVAKVLLKEI